MASGQNIGEGINCLGDLNRMEKSGGVRARAQRAMYRLVEVDGSMSEG